MAGQPLSNSRPMLSRAASRLGRVKPPSRSKQQYDVFLSHAGTEKNGPIVDLISRLNRDYPHIQCFLDLNLPLGERNDVNMRLFARTTTVALVYLSPTYLIRKWPMLELCIFYDSARRRDPEHASTWKAERRSSVIWGGEAVAADWTEGELQSLPRGKLKVVPLLHDNLNFGDIDSMKKAVKETAGMAIPELEVWKEYLNKHPRERQALENELRIFQGMLKDEDKKAVWLDMVGWLTRHSGHVLNTSIPEAGQIDIVVDKIAKVVGVAPKFCDANVFFVDFKDTNGKSVLGELKARVLSTEHPEPRFVQVVGESGLGRTTLLERLCDDADVREHFGKSVAYLKDLSRYKVNGPNSEELAEKYRYLALALTSARLAEFAGEQTVRQFEELCKRPTSKPFLIVLEGLESKEGYERFAVRCLPAGSVVLVSSARKLRGNREWGWEQEPLRLEPWGLEDCKTLFAWYALGCGVDDVTGDDLEGLTDVAEACDGFPSSMQEQAKRAKTQLLAAAAAGQKRSEAWEDIEDMCNGWGAGNSLSKRETVYKVAFDSLDQAEQTMLLDLVLLVDDAYETSAGVGVPKEVALQIWGAALRSGRSSFALEMRSHQAATSLAKAVDLELLSLETKESAYPDKGRVVEVISLKKPLISVLMRTLLGAPEQENQHHVLPQLLGPLSSLPDSLPKARKAFFKDQARGDLLSTSKLLQRMSGLECLGLTFSDTFRAAEKTPCLPFPSSFAHLRRLLYLNLSGCKLSNLPREVFRLPALRTLILQNCAPEAVLSIPSDIKNLRTLEVLDLSFSQGLVSLPEEVGGLQKLEQLLLQGCCNLTTLPLELSACEELVRLDVQHCTSLRELPKGLCKEFTKFGPVHAWRTRVLEWPKTGLTNELLENADPKGWSFCVRRLDAILSKLSAYFLLAKSSYGEALASSLDTKSLLEPGEQEAAESIVNALCSLRGGGGQSEAVLIDAAQAGALRVLARASACPAVSQQLRQKALQALEAQVKAKSPAVLNSSVSAKGPAVRNSSVIAKGAVPRKRDLLHSLVRLWVEEDSKPGQEDRVLLELASKVFEAMRAALRSGVGAAKRVRWRVLWAAAVVARTQGALGKLADPASLRGSTSATSPPGAWLSTITNKLLCAQGNSKVEPTEKIPMGLATVEVATEEAVAGKLIGICFPENFLLEQVPSLEDTLSALSLTDARFRLLVLDAPSVQVWLGRGGNIAGHLLSPWERQQEVADALIAQYDEVHVAEGERHSDPFVIVDGDTGKVIQQYGAQVISNIRSIAPGKQLDVKDLYPFTTDHLLTLLGGFEDVRTSLLLKKDPQAFEAYSRMSVPAALSAIRRQKEFQPFICSVRSGDPLPSIYVPAIKAQKIARLFQSKHAPSFAQVLPASSSDMGTTGISGSLVRLGGAMNLVLSCELELPRGTYTVAWRLAASKIAVDGFVSATTFTANIDQEGAKRQTVQRVVDFSSVADYPSSELSLSQDQQDSASSDSSFDDSDSDDSDSGEPNLGVPTTQKWKEMEVKDIVVRPAKEGASTSLVKIECRISDKKMEDRSYQIPKMHLDLDALVIRPADVKESRQVWWLCEEAFRWDNLQAPVSRTALYRNQDFLSFLKAKWNLSELALRDIVASGLQEGHLPFLKNSAQWDLWFSSIGDSAAAARWADAHLQEGASLLESVGEDIEEWKFLSEQVRSEMKAEEIECVEKVAYLTEAQQRRLGMQETERLLVAQISKEYRQGPLEQEADEQGSGQGKELAEHIAPSLDDGSSPLARALAAWGVPRVKVAALLAEGWTLEDLPPMIDTKWWRLLLPEEPCRQEAAAALPSITAGLREASGNKPLGGEANGSKPSEKTARGNKASDRDASVYEPSDKRASGIEPSDEEDSGDEPSDGEESGDEQKTDAVMGADPKAEESDSEEASDVESLEEDLLVAAPRLPGRKTASQELLSRPQSRRRAGPFGAAVGQPELLLGSQRLSQAKGKWPQVCRARAQLVASVACGPTPRQLLKCCHVSATQRARPSRAALPKGLALSRWREISTPARSQASIRCSTSRPFQKRLLCVARPRSHESLQKRLLSWA